ncbi:MAG: hypothetical protein NTW25_04155 [Candidatus Kapabacteria bacterium]|nr:hypothetical protein [Candidatus Kapabacteria bacterium]
MNFFRKLIFLTLSLYMIYCSEKVTNNIVQIRPTGNLNLIDSSYNTDKDEIAPVLRPIIDKAISNPFYREFLMPKSNYKEIRPSFKFAKEVLFTNYYNTPAYQYLTSNFEHITFLDYNSGFISFSHVPSGSYLSKIGLPFENLKDIEGGTDIFQFELTDNNDEFKFKRLESIGVVNSQFWDSHPFAADTIINGKRCTILLWSSDKDYPYSDLITAEGKTIKRGNTEIYYSFRVDGKWTSAKKLQRDINDSLSNEGTPFLFCLCNNPTLFFSSNRNNANREDYDIYHVRIKIDLSMINKNIELMEIAQDGQVTKFEKNDQEKGKKGQNDILGTFNSSADERFPFIPNPVSDTNDRFLYISSNRNSNTMSYGQDTVLKSAGNYDIYRFPLDKSFKCEPKKPDTIIPPKLYVRVTVNEYKLNQRYDSTESKKKPKFVYDTISRNENIVDADYYMNGKSLKSQIVYPVNTSSTYSFSRQLKNINCFSSECETAELSTPEKIYVTDTIPIILNCYTRNNLPIVVDTSLSKGISMFVTGYWWPLTSKNYERFKEKGKNGELKTSQFIDSLDYKYYDEVTKKNDEWLDNFYKSIEETIIKFDDCSNTQKLVITTHGYTDHCRLRPTANDEFTKFSSDGDIVFNDVLVPAGTDMKNPKLKLTSGTEYKLPIPSENGNAMLSMLRAYFTKVTIEEGIKNRLKSKPQLLEKYNKIINYQMNYFGVFEEVGCPKIMKDIIAMDLPNTPAKPESCNDPRSRRVMVFVHTVPSNLLDSKFVCNKCGELNPYLKNRTITFNSDSSKGSKKHSKKEDKAESMKESVGKKVISDETAGRPKPGAKGSSEFYAPPGMGCPGPCFWIEYATAKDESDFNFIKSILNSLGINDVRRDPRYSDKFILISATNADKVLVKESAKSFEKLLRERLSGFVDIKSVNVKLMPED